MPTLRQKAEKLAKMRPSKATFEYSVYEMQRLIRELEIHQIELELQNEALFQSKEQTENSKIRYSELYDFAPSGYFTLNREGEILEANLYGAQILGKERLYLTSERFDNFVNEETLKIYKEFLQRVFKSKKRESCEVILATTSNRRLYAQLNGVISENSQHCLLTVADISGIKEAKEALFVSEEKHRNNFILLNSILESPTSIIIFSLDTNYCYTAFTKFHHETILKIWGVDIQIGMNILEVISSLQDREKARKNFDLALSGEYFIVTEEYGDQTLIRTFFEDYYSPLKDYKGKIIGLSVFVIDITERKQAEERLIRLNILYSIRSEINKTIIRVKEPEALLESICKVAVEYGKFKMAWIGMIDKDSEMVIPKYFAGEEQGYLSTLQVSYLNNEFGRGPCGTSIREGRCIISQNIELDPRMHPWREKALRCNFRSSASVPFRCNGVTMGSFTVYSDKSYGFDSESEILLNEIGNDISYALDALEAGKRRSQIEEELHEAYRRIEGIIEAAHIGTWEWNLQTGESVLNEECARIMGYRSEELTPFNIKTVMDYTDRDDLKRSAELLEKHFKGELPYYDCEGKIKHKDGHWVWVHDRGRVISYTEDGKPLLMFGTHIDITARKQAEEEIKESEEKYRSLFSTDKNALFLIDKQTLDILEVNESACQLFGYSKEEMIGLKIINLSAEPGKSKMAIANLNSRVDLRYYTKRDGTVFPVDIFASQFSLRNRPVVFASFRDITERESRNLEIKLKNEELQKLNAEKDKFFSIISHDLRTPFNGFLGLTEMMADGLSRMTLDEIQSLAILMKESASNLYRLLGNLLEWSKMQRGLANFAPVSIILLSKITECCQNSHEAARKKEIDFQLDIPAGLTVIADVHMFESIMRNLCYNAVKFTPKKGKVTISAKSNPDNLIKISIKDTGIGMSPEILGHLFSLDISTNRKGTDDEPSTGLGLILCKDFIEKHGSKLKIKSKPEKGSTFSFMLPQYLNY